MFVEIIETIDYVISEQEVCHGDSTTEKRNAWGSNIYWSLKRRAVVFEKDELGNPDVSTLIALSYL